MAFKSLYGKDGIYDRLYSKRGSSPPIERTDIRLGDYGYFGQADDDDEGDEEAPSGGPVKPPIFAKEYKGFPMWLLGIFLLGFSWAVRKKKTSKAVSE